MENIWRLVIAIDVGSAAFLWPASLPNDYGVTCVPETSPTISHRKDPVGGASSISFSAQDSIRLRR
jgi:hypothetical protein